MHSCSEWVTFFLLLCPHDMLAAPAVKSSGKLPYEDDPQNEKFQRIDDILGSGKEFHVVYLTFNMSVPIRCISMYVEESSDGPNSQFKTLQVKFRDIESWAQYQVPVTVVSYKTGNHGQNNSVGIIIDEAADVTSSTKSVMPEGTSNSTSIALSYKLMYLDSKKTCAVLRMLASQNDCVLLLSDGKEDNPSDSECEDIYTNNCGEKYAVYSASCKYDSTSPKQPVE